MFGSERRRQQEAQDATDLLRGLAPAQLATLATLEGFRWRLAFVRRPIFATPVPVLFDRSGLRFVVIEPDGSIDETPALRVRA